MHVCERCDLVWSVKPPMSQPSQDNRTKDNWTHWGLNPGPSACEAGVIPLHHAPFDEFHCDEMCMHTAMNILSRTVARDNNNNPLFHVLMQVFKAPPPCATDALTNAARVSVFATPRPEAVPRINSAGVCFL